MKLLFDLCKTITVEPRQLGRGRLKLPIREAVFASGLKFDSLPISSFKIFTLEF